MDINEFPFWIYGKTQGIYHKIMGKKRGPGQYLFFLYDNRKAIDLQASLKNVKVNGNPIDGNGSVFFKGDNYSDKAFTVPSTAYHPTHFKGGTPEEKWLQCIRNAKVEPGWANEGFYLTAYTKETRQWGLSNWIWTSAAVARALSRLGFKDDAKLVADAFIRNQLPCGGWIVRYDIICGRVVRLVAPNDSAYIARNSLIVTYRDTNDKKYLNAAQKCADWIMETSCDDRLVLFGYDADSEEWITDRNIVDIGFTACLFADLYEITGEEKYRSFLAQFINAYIRTFYDMNAKLFASHINKDRKQNGGYFSRGQAWALEGLIAAYRVLEDNEIKNVIENVTQCIAKHQRSGGGWYCNFQKSRSLMGEDCKGIAPIGKALLDWSTFSKNREEMVNSAQKALEWCERHTDDATGTILSFSCNGAISHSQNTSTGILYANAYALEIKKILEGK